MKDLLFSYDKPEDFVIMKELLIWDVPCNLPSPTGKDITKSNCIFFKPSKALINYYTKLFGKKRAMELLPFGIASRPNPPKFITNEMEQINWPANQFHNGGKCENGKSVRYEFEVFTTIQMSEAIKRYPNVIKTTANTGAVYVK